MGSNCCVRRDVSTKDMDCTESESDLHKRESVTETPPRQVFMFEEHEEKIKTIQSGWRKKKEKDEMCQRIRVLDSNMSKLGKQISVEEMNAKISPQLQEIRKNLKAIPGIDMAKSEKNENLIYRRPFVFNYEGYIYHGYWNKLGLREGFGVCISQDGSVQEGLWLEGRLVKGRIFDYDGCYYEGEVQDGEPHGNGTRYGSGGQTFRGQWKKGKQHLYGERIFKDGFKFNGIMKENLFHGKGVFTWPDGTVYDGNFENSSLKGFGHYKTPNGDIYEGEWENNLPHGKGVYIHAGNAIGQRYEGSYNQGKKEGLGKFIFRNDTYYNGEWKNGLPNGNGEYKFKDTTYVGFFRHGRLVYLNNGQTLHEEITITCEKEDFKPKSQLTHLVDSEGTIIKNTTPKSNVYRASNGSEFLNKFIEKKIVENIASE